MSRIPRLAIIPILVVLLALLAAGCGSSETGETPAATTTQTSTTATQSLDLAAIVAEALQATVSAESYKGDMSLSMEMTQGSDSSFMDMTMGADMILDQADNAMYMSMTTEIDMEESGGEQEVKMDMYIFSDYMYIMMDIPGMGSQWIKVPVNNEIMEVFGASQLQDDLYALDSPADLEYVRTETYDGTECYVIRLVPNDEKLLEFARQQNTSDVEIDWDAIENIKSILPEMEYTIWVAEDSRYVLKMEINAVMDFTALAASIDPSLEGMKANMTSTTRFSDYNSAPAISLPDEAQNAIEMSAEDFLS